MSDHIWRVSADTKMCGSPLKLRLLAVSVCLLGKHGGILPGLQTKVK